jgi:ACS family hexuronate transporter-like MFS transporter
MVLISILCGLGYMMYSVDRMVMSTSVGLVAKEFGLSSGMSGVLLSSFFYGFIAFLFISGILSDKISGKPVLIFGMVLFSLATGLTGIAAGFSTMLVFRIITGIGEGIFWPAASLEVSNATPEKYRTTVMSLYWAGYPLGGFFGTWLGANIGPAYGWRMVFFIACALGIIIAILYGILVKSSKPDVHTQHKAVAEKVSIRMIFSYRSVIIVAFYYFVLLSGWWIVLLWAPTFLMNVKHMSLAQGGTIASLLGLSGALGGYLIGRYCDAGTMQRKKLVLVAITILSGLLMAALVVDFPTWLIIVLILLLGFFGYPITPVVLSITSQLVPKQLTGSAVGFVMNIGMVAGGISPVLAGVFSKSYGMSGVWFLAALIMFVSSFLIFFTSKVEKPNMDNISSMKSLKNNVSEPI